MFGVDGCCGAVPEFGLLDEFVCGPQVTTFHAVVPYVDIEPDKGDRKRSVRGKRKARMRKCEWDSGDQKNETHILSPAHC